MMADEKIPEEAASEKAPMTQYELQAELERLHISLERLNNQKFFKMYSSWPRLVFSSLVRGLFVGLGSVIGATVLLYFLIEFLSRIDFIPIVGEWAKEIIVIIDGNGGHDAS